MKTPDRYLGPKITSAILTFNMLWQAACSPTPSFEQPKVTPGTNGDGGGRATETTPGQTIATPEVVMTATAEIFGGGEFGVILTNENDPEAVEYANSRKLLAREHIASLENIADGDLNFLQFGIVKDGKTIVTDELILAQNPVNPDQSNLFLTSRISMANNIPVDVYSPLLLKESQIVFIDPTTGEQKVWMEEIASKPGSSMYYPYGGMPIEIKMDLDSVSTGGAKQAMVAYVNKDTLLSFDASSDGLSYKIGDQEYGLDKAAGKWVKVYTAAAWASEAPARADFLANGGQVDLIAGVAWDAKTGLVMFAKDAKGEWINYPGGNVPIPPGPGQEGEPLMVPIYHTFTDAMWAVTDELPWGDVTAYQYRKSQIMAINNENNKYWRPIWNNGAWEHKLQKSVDIHVTNQPKSIAGVDIYDVQLPSGEIVMRVVWGSITTDYYYKSVFIYGDAQKLDAELARIDQCANDNWKAPDLATICKSDMIYVPKRGEVKK